MKKYVAVMNIPSPYRLHSLNETYKALKERGIAFECHFMNRTHKDRPKSWLNPKIPFPHKYWRNYGTDQHEFNLGLIIHLLCNQPDFLFLSDPFDTFTGIFTLLGCRNSIRIAWCEGNTKTPGTLGGILGWIKRLVYGVCQFIGVPGMDAVRYVQLHRDRTSKKLPPCVMLPNLVDETRFCKKEVNDQDEGEQRICLIPARLDPVKGLVPFFELLTPEMLNGWKIRLMGQGPLKAEIKATLEKRGIVKFVEIVDYVPYDEMPQYYATSDLLLLPSIYDPNPLTVVEALHSGLAIALSSQAGNVEEAVREGENGWVLHVNDESRFREELQQIFAMSREDLRKMGNVSLSEVSKFWNTKEAVKKFLDSIGAIKS